MQERLRKYLTLNEGSRSLVYLDHLGNRTIGVGFNLERADAPGLIAGLGLDFDEVANGEVELTQEQIDALLDTDIQAARDAARRVVASFDDLERDRAIVVIDMIFNLGEAGFRKFRNCIAAINESDWERAAHEIGDSRYAVQVPNRARRNIQAMRQGLLPEDYMAQAD